METAGQHNEEVQTFSVWSGGSEPGHTHTHGHTLKKEIQNETEINDAGMGATQLSVSPQLSRDLLGAILEKVSSEEVYRVKGFLLLALNIRESTPQPEDTYFILNWAFGRYELHAASVEMGIRLRKDGIRVRLTVMGARGQMDMQVRSLAKGLGANMT